MDGELNRPKFPSWVWVAVLCTAIVAGVSVYRRNQVESANRATELSAEYESVEALAAGQGIPIDKAIEDLKAQGLTTLVISEESVGETIAAGAVTMESSTVNNGTVHLSSLVFRDLSLAPRVERGLRLRFGNLATSLTLRGNRLGLPAISPGLVRQTAIGLPPEECATAKLHGLNIVARAGNPMGISAKSVRNTLAWIQESGASVFLAQGDQVIGRRDALPETISALKDLNFLYATPEFAKIGGDSNIVEAMPDRTIRLHTAQVAELDKLTLADALERYVKAARERNMRILLIRPLSLSGDQPLTDFASFVKQIGDGIRKEGGEIGLAHPFTEPDVPHVLFLVLGLLGGLVTYGLIEVLTENRRARLIGGVICLLLGAACVTRMGTHIMALLASMSLPILGFCALDAIRPPKMPEPLRILFGLLLVSFFSVVGGLFVAGMLNGLPFYVVADEFKGIKVSVFLPIVAAGALYAYRYTDWRQTLRNPITWGSTLLGVGLLGAFAFMIARTGNDSGVGASGGEMMMRSFLERVMYVRPRTKEFVVGHPMLIVAIGMFYRYADSREHPKVQPLVSWMIVVLTVGAMGQTDIVNTLCHLHIPVALSLARITLGLVLGCIFGFVLWMLVERVLPKMEKLIGV